MTQPGNTPPAISIVTPSFNQGKYIRRTIESVLSQGVALEFIIMDGGSTDATTDILREYGSALQWVSEPDKGQADGVNKGILAANAELIGWLNSDDIYYPGALKTVLDFFDQHPEVDAVYGDAHHIDEQDNILEAYYTEDWNLQRLFDVCFICQPALFFRKRLIAAHGLLDITYNTCMDYELWVRWGLKGARFHHLPVTLAGSRLYPQNKTLRNREKVHREINDMLKHHLGHVPERWLHNYGYAVGDTLKIDRARALRFSLVATACTWYASLRWNGRLPGSLVRPTCAWVRGNFKQAIRGK